MHFNLTKYIIFLRKDPLLPPPGVQPSGPRQTPPQARGLLTSFVPYKNLPKPMIRTLLYIIIIVYDKIRTFLCYVSDDLF